MIGLLVVVLPELLNPTGTASQQLARRESLHVHTYINIARCPLAPASERNCCILLYKNSE